MNFVDTFLTPVSTKTAKSDVERRTLAVGARGARRPIAMVRRLGMAMAIWEFMEDLLEAAMTDEELEIVGRQLGPEPGGNFSGAWADTRCRATATLETLRPAALTSAAPPWGGRA